MNKTKPLVPWIGGKTRLSADIIKLLPKHHCYCEPFAGAAGVFFAKPQSKVEVLNDINGELVNLYRIVQNHPEEFIHQFKWALTSRESFLRHQNTNPENLTDIQRAARFFYLQKHAFGGLVENQTFGTSPTRRTGFNIMRIEEDLSNAHFRLSQVFIENLSWKECIKKYDRDSSVFFCDPPYFNTVGYGNSFPLTEYEELAKIALKSKGKLIITVNNIKEMKDIFNSKRFNKKVKTLRYTCTNQGKNQAKKAEELIITC